jgi:trigger factor
MSLNVTVEPRDHRQVAVRIEAPRERVEKELRKAANKIASQYRIPGFRKGKAPYNLIVQQVGLSSLIGEFADELGQELFKEAIEQEKIEPYAVASLEDIQIDPLTYTLLVPLEPEIRLGDYRSLRLEETHPEVNQEQIDRQLEQIREQYSSWQSVERPSQFGDLMTIDVRSVIIAEDGSETVVLEETDWDMTPDEENPADPPGLDAALIGLSTGEEKEFDLTWPEDSRSIHAGKTAHFSVVVKNIQAYEKAELNDDLARLVGPDFETIDDLKASIRSTLAQAESRRAEQEYTQQALDRLVEISELDYPPVVIEDQLDSMMNDLAQRLRTYGIDDMDKYFEQTNQDKDEYRASLIPDATRIAHNNLVLSELIRVEQLDVTDEDIDARLEEMFGADEELDSGINNQRNNMLSMMRSDAGRSILVSQILHEKAVQRLLAIVRGEEIPAPAQPASDSDIAASIPVADDQDAAPQKDQD